jgi:ankyrin repeat protein
MCCSLCGFEFFSGFENIVETLMRNGADANLKNQNNDSAMDIATRKGTVYITISIIYHRNNPLFCTGKNKIIAILKRRPAEKGNDFFKYITS